jgi:hypothetical protein
MPRKTLKRRKSRRRTAKKRGGAKKYFKKFCEYYETDVEGNKITPEESLGEIAPVGEQWDNVDHRGRMGTPEGVDD